MTDALWVTKRACFHACMLPDSGALEFSYALDFNKRYRTRMLPEVLALVHTDAENRLSAAAAKADRALRRRQALDQIATWQYVLAEHGAALRALTPRQYRMALRAITRSHTLAGHSRHGVRHGAACIRSAPPSATDFAALLLAVAGERATAWASKLCAKLRRRKREKPTRSVGWRRICRYVQ